MTKIRSRKLRLYDITYLAERVCDEAVCVCEDGYGWTMCFDIKNRNTFHVWLDVMEGDPIIVEIDTRYAYVKHPNVGDIIKVDIESDIDIARAVCKFAMEKLREDEKNVGVTD